MKKKKIKKRLKPRKPRDWNAVNAHFRKGGAMKDRKKEKNKKICRDEVKEHE